MSAESASAADERAVCVEGAAGVAVGAAGAAGASAGGASSSWRSAGISFSWIDSLAGNPFTRKKMSARRVRGISMIPVWGEGSGNTCRTSYTWSVASTSTCASW